MTRSDTIQTAVMHSAAAEIMVNCSTEEELLALLSGDIEEDGTVSIPKSYLKAISEIIRGAYQNEPYANMIKKFISDNDKFISVIDFLKQLNLVEE